MSQAPGLTTISEEDIARHRAVAQSMVTRFVVLERQDGKSSTPLAGTNRRFVSTVSTSGDRRTREVELAKAVQAIRPDDQMLSIAQHTLLFRARRGVAVALAVADMFARQTDLESLQARNAGAPLQGEDAERFNGAAADRGHRLRAGQEIHRARHLPRIS